MDIVVLRKIQHVVVQLAKRLGDLEQSVALLSRDINPLEYQRFLALTPDINWLMDPMTANWHNVKVSNRETAQWVHNYAVSTIIALQKLDNPMHFGPIRETADQILHSDGRNIIDSPYAASV